MVVRFALLMLAHLVHQRHNAKDSKGEQHDDGKTDGPTLSIIQCFNKHHGAKNGNQDADGEEWKFHSKEVCRGKNKGWRVF